MGSKNRTGPDFQTLNVTSDYDADMDCESIDDDEVDIVDIPSDTDHNDSDIDDFFEYDD